MIIKVDNGYVRYSIEDDEVIIENVEAFEKRNGTGSELVKMVIEIAEKEEKPCTLCAYPQDDSISLEALVAFYADLGFDIDMMQVMPC